MVMLAPAKSGFPAAPQLEKTRNKKLGKKNDEM
jgi:hypothetical protein